MTEKIPLSALAGITPEDFAAVVEVHAANLREHAAHHRGIGAVGDQRQPYPVPHSIPLVDRCVRRPDFSLDYEIVDDGPTPEERLRARKNEIIMAIQAQQDARVAEIIPPGKRALFAMQESDDLPEHREEVMARRARIDPISRLAAVLCAEVEDLTEETIQGWTWKL